MYQAKSEKEVKKRFKHIKMLLKIPEYQRCLTTFKRMFKKWKALILNYFKNKTTNGFTESCYTKIKIIK